MLARLYAPILSVWKDKREHGDEVRYVDDTTVDMKLRGADLVLQTPELQRKEERSKVMWLEPLADMLLENTNLVLWRSDYCV